ncbi:MAG: hypothetical protein PWP28_1391 [Oceanotoga sp.]|uniref:hypothetical protein n=1 Tax=Oceanotoga sp. TaxID=2108366 RepID=UPI00264F5072|nr:hypothetical protein [Oceanotoga sp.]MDN5342516.1 hypothetical protein [Oceanotoga sp.]
MDKNVKLYIDYYGDLSSNSKSKYYDYIQSNYDIKNFLYAGSYCDITPSFYFPEGVYVDLYNKKLNNFFDSDEVLNLVDSKKRYSESSEINFIKTNYENLVYDKNVDLLISFNAGFVSKYCDKYLKKEGLLLVDDDQLDGTYAFLTDKYKIIGHFEDKKFIEDDTLKLSIDTDELSLDIFEVNYNYSRLKRRLYKKNNALVYLFKKII